MDEEKADTSPSEEPEADEDSADEEEAVLPPIAIVEIAPPTPHPRTTLKGGITLALAAILGAVVVGTLWHLIGLHFEIVFWTPLVAGFCLSIFLYLGAAKARWRDVKSLRAIAVAATLLVFVVRLYADSVAARPFLVHAVAKTIAQRHGMLPSDVEPYAEKVLTPVTAFRLYLILAAEQGIVETRVGGFETSPPDHHISGGGYWVALAIDLLIATGVTIFICDLVTGVPACNACGRWGKRTTLFRRQARDAELLCDAIRAQDWLAADRIPTGGKVKVNSCADAYLLRCGQCRSDVLTLKRTQKGKEEYLFYAPLTPQDAARVRAAVRAIA